MYSVGLQLIVQDNTKQLNNTKASAKFRCNGFFCRKLNILILSVAKHLLIFPFRVFLFVAAVKRRIRERTLDCRGRAACRAHTTASSREETPVQHSCRASLLWRALLLRGGKETESTRGGVQKKKDRKNHGNLLLLCGCSLTLLFGVGEPSMFACMCLWLSSVFVCFEITPPQTPNVHPAPPWSTSTFSRANDDPASTVHYISHYQQAHREVTCWKLSYLLVGKKWVPAQELLFDAINWLKIRQ